MTGSDRSGKRGGRLWRLLGRNGTAGDIEPGEAAVEDEAAECTPICDCADGPEGRPMVFVSGTLRTVSERTVAGLPALEAELDDGTAVLDVIWLGRHTIAGIEPGRRLTASGRITVSRGRPVLFNPRYELRPLGTE
ncbi:OB-fold nucleic acid binding domain-containing protein [Streptomyces sodiiphilus]|uniref:OB-fold nucleic acid binding domain-containing protein n=1 Tax=Streptomyces sodiiphilus TaxID=226217 RepID=A0ABN2PIQ2_9ACTN